MKNLVICLCNIFVIVAFTVLTACNTVGNKMPEESIAAEKVSGGEVQGVEYDVAKRAEARWRKLIDHDLKQAYGYFSPSSQMMLPWKIYVSRIKPGLWQDVEIRNVACTEEVCTVDLVVFYTYAGIQDLEMKRKESWIEDQGSWWYVAKKGADY